MIKVYFQNKTKRSIYGLKKLFKNIADFTCKYLNEDNKFELSVTFVGKQRIKSINRDYRNIDRVTDVISFAFLDNDIGNICLNNNIPVALGDIFICCDVAKKQAKQYGHSLKREYAFLFLHGLLHLFGYDHMSEEDEKVMFSLQDEILNNLDIRRV